MAVSMSKSGSKEDQWERKIANAFFSGLGRTSLRFHYETDLGSTSINLAWWEGEYQDLIMWEQLTDPARVAMNDISNFGDAEPEVAVGGCFLKDINLQICDHVYRIASVI
ncbi:hypothetical protein PInf_008899 [Phytophthora infestans]|nr:hypothetical protein PInf_008899 [Phytophthora infestans]